MKQNFQKLIERKFKELVYANNVYLKQKDEKINSLEGKSEKVNKFRIFKIFLIGKLNIHKIKRYIK